MAENDQSLIDQLNARIGDLQRSYDEAKAKNDQISRQIDQLKEARCYVRSAKDYAKDAQKDIKNIKPEDNWKGKRRTGFDNAQDDRLAQATESFRERIEDLDGQIGSKIWDLRMSFNYGVGILSGIEDSLTFAGNELKKLCS